MIILGLLLAAWGFVRFYRWLTAPPRYAIVEPDPEIVLTEAVELLEQAGYSVLTNKRKISITARLGEEDARTSRLFVDHFVEKEGKLYLVKLEKPRKPLEWTGSGLRDRLLVYQLLYPEAAGILYVNPKEPSIELIRFEVHR